MIKVRDLEFEYYDRDEENNLTDMINAIGGINFDAEEGEFIGIAGRNGSGKSTFAKILNRLLVPIEGTVMVGDIDALDSKNIYEVRKRVGMVFQNPDNQLVGSIVAEDVAFGAENLGVSQSKLWDGVYEALSMVGIEDVKAFAKKRVDELSGGEKQKVAIASVLAMKTKCIVLDEATSMLDAESRKEILEVLLKLNKENNITIILITHIMEELLLCDKIYIFDKGYLMKKGRREGIFSDENVINELGLELPDVMNIANKLKKKNIISNNQLYSIEDVVKQIKIDNRHSFLKDISLETPKDYEKKVNPHKSIIIDKLSVAYGKKQVLNNISFSISKGEYVAIIGPTGAGKSTLLSSIAGLVKIKDGNVYIDGVDIANCKGEEKDIRKKIGYLFQYPEQQLFAENSYEDVVFGPRNMGVSEVEAEKRAYEAIEMVGLSQDVYDLPVSKLSGGQKRRLALAGVLAMQPEYLILDEPTAGLDPEGKNDMLEIIKALHKQAGITIIMVSHDVNTVSEYAERVLFIKDGGIVDIGNPDYMFYRNSLDENAFDSYVPTINKLLVKLRVAGLPVRCQVKGINQGIKAIEEALL